MAFVEDRLREFGYELPEVPAPVAAYVPAVRRGNLVYTSGQLPFVNGSLPRTGKVGAEVTAEQAEELTELCALNGLAAARGLLGTLDSISQVVKVTAYVASAPNFTDQAMVSNGASLLLGKIFGDAGIHARTSIGVAVLPMDSPVEVEFIFEIAEA